MVVVWKLDRLSRSLKDVLILMEKIAQIEAGFRSLTETIDTTSAGGRMMIQIVGTFAEFERAMLRERTRSGLDMARKQGRVGGRRPKLKTQQREEILHLVHSGQKTAADAARLWGLGSNRTANRLKRPISPMAVTPDHVRITFREAVAVVRLAGDIVHWRHANRL